MNPTELHPATQGSSAFDRILVQCRDLASGQLELAIAGMLAKADEALAELAVKTTDREAQKHVLEARDLAQAQRAAMEQLFRTRYLGEFQQRSNKARKISGNFSDYHSSSLGLSLVADDDLDESLKFNEMAARLRRYCEEEINALDQRVGVLLGDADLQSEENPFSPQAICDAYKMTCRQVAENIEVRAIFLKLFDDHVLDAIRAVYKAVNELLVQNSILPKIRYAVSRQEGGKPPPREARGEGEKSAGEAAAPAGNQDMFAMLQKLLATAGAGGPGGGGAGGGAGTASGLPVLQGAELLGSLTKLQLDGLSAIAAAGAALPAGGGSNETTNVLHHLKTTNVGTSMGRMDAMTLDIVAMLFDQLFDDPKIPLGAKGLIGRLQIPMLKVAIADKELFSKKTHPARVLLDTLGEIAIRLPADFNTASALFARLEAILQELITGFEDDVGIFYTIRERLVALMAEEDRRVEQDSESAAKRIVQEETLAVAKSVAEDEVRARVQANPLPGPVLEFLIEQWLKLLLIIHVKRGPGSDPWKHAIEAMDQLVWSVQPKDSLEERRKLASIVPQLLKRLSAGLQVASIEEEIREDFFASLMKYHTKILHAEAKDKAAAAPTKAPQGVKQSTTPPAEPAFTRSITVRNPFGGGDVQVNELDFATPPPANDALQPPRTAKEAGLPDSLQPGDWVEFRDNGAETRHPVRLIFVSPRKTRFIFSDRGEKNYIECTRSEIARRFRASEAVLMDEVPEVPLFERIMVDVVEKMRRVAA